MPARREQREQQPAETPQRNQRARKAPALAILLFLASAIFAVGGTRWLTGPRTSPPRNPPATLVQPPLVRRWTVNETFSSNGFQFTVLNVRQELSWSRSGDLWTGVELEVAAPANNSTLDWTRLLTVDTTHDPMLPSTVGEAPNSTKSPLQLKAGVTRKFALNFFGPKGWDAVSITLPDGRVVPLKPSR